MEAALERSPKGTTAWKHVIRRIIIKIGPTFLRISPFTHNPENRMLHNGPYTPPKMPLPVGSSALSSNTWFHGTTRLSIRNGILIGAAVFAQLKPEGPHTL